MKSIGVRFAAQFPPLFQVPFSSERKRMTTVVRHGNRLVTLVKGAPEWLLQSSTQFLGADGVSKPWTSEARDTVEAARSDAAAQAMRTLAFGYAVLPADLCADEGSLKAGTDVEHDLVFTGLATIRDPLRPDVKEAIARCREAGIEVKMITGDHVETARAIGFEIGLLDRRDAPIDTDDAVVITSAVFNERFTRLKQLHAAGDTEGSKTERKRLTSFRILARAEPLDKYKMVELLQEEGHVVAVTGDGTNDAPALKKADVGLSMGITGTEVAKEASKIVLLDDSFATIVKAVQWGRSLYENIQRFIQFQLTINVSALAIAFLGPFLGIRPPFTVLQLLWINVIMDTLASIALCSEPPRQSVMRTPPRKRDENIVTTAMARSIFATAAFFIAAMMVLLAGMQWGRWFAGEKPPSNDFPGLTLRQVTIFFTVYVLFQVWNQINCRSLTPEISGFHNLFANKAFLAIAATVLAGQVLIVSLPSLGVVFKTEPLSIMDWLLILAGTASVLVFAETTRRLRRA